MIGTKLYTKISRVYFFLLMCGILAIAGGAHAIRSVARSENLSNAAGFMMIFGAGMFIVTLAKNGQLQIAVHEDYLTQKQSRTQQLVRPRHIMTVLRPDKNRLFITLREDDDRKD